ncbi:hypothetical protein HMPREF9406_2879 [Clostridium sp. HGF2]|nr:hypothetical protein HMPREF9406_2879 [Clostridium sp. HGF2]
MEGCCAFMMKGSIADVVCLFLYGSKESCNAYAQLMSFFNLFMRIGMPQSRRHMAASEKNSICQNSAVCFYVLCFYQNLYGLYVGFFVCFLRESSCILAKVHKFRTNSF